MFLTRVTGLLQTYDIPPCFCCQVLSQVPLCCCRMCHPPFPFVPLLDFLMWNHRALGAQNCHLGLLCACWALVLSVARKELSLPSTPNWIHPCRTFLGFAPHLLAGKCHPWMVPAKLGPVKPTCRARFLGGMKCPWLWLSPQLTCPGLLPGKGDCKGSKYILELQEHKDRCVPSVLCCGSCPGGFGGLREVCAAPLWAQRGAAPPKPLPVPSPSPVSLPGGSAEPSFGQHTG